MEDMSATPETDAAEIDAEIDISDAWQNGSCRAAVVDVDFARKLERQRDALAQLLLEAHDQVDCATGDPDLDAERQILKRRISAALSSL